MKKINMQYSGNGNIVGLLFIHFYFFHIGFLKLFQKFQQKSAKLHILSQK